MGGAVAALAAVLLLPVGVEARSLQKRDIIHGVWDLVMLTLAFLIYSLRRKRAALDRAEKMVTIEKGVLRQGTSFAEGKKGGAGQGQVMQNLLNARRKVGKAKKRGNNRASAAAVPLDVTAPLAVEAEKARKRTAAQENARRHSMPGQPATTL